MFRPENRSSLTELLAPPAGYAVSAAFGTTYCLDFCALAAASLALGGSDAGDEARPLTRSDLLRSLARLSKRMLIVTNQAMIDFDADGRRRRLGALLDRCIRAIGTPNAAFHPKVWVVRYGATGAQRETLFRLICGSRNLTKTSTWELMIACEGTKQAGSSAFGRSVAEFVDQTASMSGVIPGFLPAFTRELASVHFETGEGEAQFLWQGSTEEALWNKAPKRCARVVVVAPFVEDKFVDQARTDLVKDDSGLTLISRQKSLDGLNDVNRAWCCKNAFVVEPGADDVSHELHAKMLLWASGDQGGLLLGSANATGAAWGLTALRNTEAMVAVQDSRAVQRFERSFVSPSAKGGNWHPWIRRYEPRDDQREASDTPQDILDGYRRRLGAVQLTGKWRRGDRADVGTLTILARPGCHAFLRGLANDDRVECSVGWLPISESVEGSTGSLSVLLERGLTFPEVEVKELSTLVSFAIRLRHPAATRHYILVLDNPEFPNNWRERRDMALVRQEILARSLGMTLVEMLLGLPPDEHDGSGGFRRSPGAPSKRGALLSDRPGRGYLEVLLDRCATDTAALEDVRETLEVFGEKDAEANELRRLLSNLAGIPG
jgi:hypothetical protein